MRPHLLGFVTLFVASATAAAPRIADIDDLVNKHGIGDDTPGVAILILQNGKTLLEKGYGLARLSDKTPLTARTTFELASVSKTFTGTALLLLQDRGLLALSDDIRKYLPEIPAYRKDHPLRISDLLHHTSGLPEYLAMKDVKAKHPQFASNADYLPQFALRKERHPLTFAPGAKHEYNNSNYMLLAAILARVSKKSYGTVLHDEIFKPLGMEDSWVYEGPGLTPKHPKRGFANAIGYEKKQKGGFRESWGSPPFRDERLLTTGDGGVWTSLHDLAKWDAAVRSSKLLRPTTWQQALKPSTTRDGKTNNYGVGWALHHDRDGKLHAFGHDGSWSGFRTSYYRDLTRDRTIVLLSNRGDFHLDAFWRAFVAILDRK